MTRPLAKRVCQLATVEHYTQLDQLVFDQHGAAQPRRDDATGARRRRSGRPLAAGGIRGLAGRIRPLAQAGDLGSESPQEFGQALYLLACRCGYRQVQEKIFAADGADWCWTIREQYFVDACGILDWYHVSEHVWQAARVLGSDAETVSDWADAALERLAGGSGRSLGQWLREQRSESRGKRRSAVDDLLRYIEPRQSLMDYPTYRARGWQIGTGLIESTVKQLVSVRLKGPGMHWSEHGAVALTALRAQLVHPRYRRLRPPPLGGYTALRGGGPAADGLPAEPPRAARR